MAACVPFDVHFARNSPFGVRLQTVFILFSTFLLFGPVCFFYKTKLKKVDPNFADRFGQSGRPTSLVVVA
jgi:hypothetical protein